jgi:LacI family transcriptional regulator
MRGSEYAPAGGLAAPTVWSLKSVTIKDVAREADVSVASVSRVLNGVGRVGEATRARILNTAERLRYIPHEGARSLITRRTATIGMVLPDLHGEFFSEMLRGADSAARARGLHLLVSTSHGDPEEAAAALRSMRGRVDGLLLMSPHLDSEFLKRHLPDGLPALLMIGPSVEGRPGVRIEDFEGAATMVRHLADNGRRRIAHIAGPAANHDAAERLRGYLAARPEPLGDEYVVRGDFTVRSGYAAGRLLAALDPMPDAIFAANDMMAAGCIDALRKLGIAVPGQIAIGGFDDVPLAALLRPALTTMRVNVADFGRRALDQLAATIEDMTRDPADDSIVPELVIRESSGGLGRREQALVGSSETGRYVE